MFMVVGSDVTRLLRLLPACAECAFYHHTPLRQMRIQHLNGIPVLSASQKHCLQSPNCESSILFQTASESFKDGNTHSWFKRWVNVKPQQCHCSSNAGSSVKRPPKSSICAFPSSNNSYFKSGGSYLFTGMLPSASQLERHTSMFCFRQSHTLSHCSHLPYINTELFSSSPANSVYSHIGINGHWMDSYRSWARVRFYRGHTRHRGSRETSEQQRFSEVKNDDGNDSYDELSESEDESDVRNLPSTDLQQTYPLQNTSDTPSLRAAMETDEGNKDIAVTKKSVDELTLPELSRVAYNIVPYVKRSETLQNLVKLGVNLDKVQKVEGMAELLIKSKFDRDILPYIKFLTLVGVEAGSVGDVLSKNPLVFTESIDDLEMRVGYLIHQKFSLEDVARIVTLAPVTLLMNPLMLQEKLKFYQDVFGLTEEEVRQVVTYFPKLLPRRKELIADVRFHVKEFIGFTNQELKQLLMKEPKIFLSGKHKLVTNFDYLHNTMLIPHDQILVWPKILLMRLFIFKNRHLFLLYKDRAQYDPCLENFVSLKALGSGSDEEFCHNVAKCDVEEFYDFCKTL